MQKAALHTGWRRPVRYFIVIGHFPHKSPRIGGSFAKRDQQLRLDDTPNAKGSRRDKTLNVCIYTHTCVSSHIRTQIHI